MSDYKLRAVIRFSLKKKCNKYSLLTKDNLFKKSLLVFHGKCALSFNKTSKGSLT